MLTERAPATEKMLDLRAGERKAEGTRMRAVAKAVARVAASACALVGARARAGRYMRSCHATQSYDLIRTKEEDSSQQQRLASGRMCLCIRER